MKFIIYTARRPENSNRSFFPKELFTGNVTEEEYAKPIEDPEKWGKATILWYNSTCQPGERRRMYLGYRVLDRSTSGMYHQWEKSCLVTQKGGYDTMRCKTCGITGKRYGLGSGPIRDPKFKADKYQYCK